MPILDDQLNEVVQAWNDYAAGRPGYLSASDLLEKRDINMYRGLGIGDANEFAKRLVDDRSVATLEMTMGYLYERLLEELGPRKITQTEKRQPGFRGIDFVQVTPTELRLVNLKSGLSTGNGDINTSTVNHLVEASRYWEEHPQADDNPLRQRNRKVVMVRAVARGSSGKTTTAEGIQWLVGESMWEYFGSGEGLLERLSEALGRNPLAYSHYQDEVSRGVARVVDFLVREGLATPTGQICWPKLVSRFP